MQTIILTNTNVMPANITRVNTVTCNKNGNKLIPTYRNNQHIWILKRPRNQVRKLEIHDGHQQLQRRGHSEVNDDAIQNPEQRQRTERQILHKHGL